MTKLQKQMFIIIAILFAIVLSMLGSLKIAKNVEPEQLNVQYETLKDFALKCIDIDGKVYATMPATEVKSISAPIELTVPTKIRLNYQNKTPSPQIFSDIDLE